MTSIKLRIDNSTNLANYWEKKAQLKLDNCHRGLRYAHIFKSRVILANAMKSARDATEAFAKARNCRLDAERLSSVVVTNQIAQAIVAELISSHSIDAIDMLVSLHNRDNTVVAQIAAEGLKRVLPNITADEYRQVVSDVLRYYADGECLDGCGDVPNANCTNC
jgi:hypothetical protein